MEKHTPGPWVVFAADMDGPADVLPAMRPGHVALNIENEHDARLIAAAPDMLRALQQLIGMLATDDTSGMKYSERIGLARAAIAKATVQ